MVPVCTCHGIQNSIEAIPISTKILAGGSLSSNESTYTPASLFSDDVRASVAQAFFKSVEASLCNKNPETRQKALWRGPVVSRCGGPAVMAQEANS